ncbi:unnamed protein product [Eretmochelys imbricata]
MYQLKVQAEPPAQSGSDMSAQELKELLWSGGECNAALIRDGAFRQKKLARQLVEGGECEEQLMAGEQQVGLGADGVSLPVSLLRTSPQLPGMDSKHFSLCFSLNSSRGALRRSWGFSRRGASTTTRGWCAARGRPIERWTWLSSVQES